MADHTEAGIVIEATVDQVLDVVADIERYPEWADGIAEAEVLATGPGGRPARARFRLDAGPIKDEYVLIYDWRPDSVGWSLESGTVFTAVDGSYTVTPAPGGVEVSYRLAVDLSIPLLGLLKRKAERAVVDTALKDLKARVEG